MLKLRTRPLRSREDGSLNQQGVGSRRVATKYLVCDGQHQFLLSAPTLLTDRDLSAARLVHALGMSGQRRLSRYRCTTPHDRGSADLCIYTLGAHQLSSQNTRLPTHGFSYSNYPPRPPTNPSPMRTHLEARGTQQEKADLLYAFRLQIKV